MAAGFLELLQVPPFQRRVMGKDEQAVRAIVTICSLCTPFWDFSKH